jgi:hypothetical protein
MMGTAKSLGKIDSLFLLNVLAFPCTFRLLLFESLVGFLLARHVRCGGNKEIGNGAHDLAHKGKNHGGLFPCAKYLLK